MQSLWAFPTIDAEQDECDRADVTLLLVVKIVRPWSVARPRPVVPAIRPWSIISIVAPRSIISMLIVTSLPVVAIFAA